MEPFPLALASEQLVGFDCGLDNWIFADDSYTPSYWLILKRESFSRYSIDPLEAIDLLFYQFDFDALVNIYRLHDLPPSHDSWNEWDYRREIQALVMASRIQVFNVSDDIAHRLSSHTDAINSDPHTSGMCTPIEVTRNALAEELGSDISARWVGKEEADRLHFSRWELTQKLIEVNDFALTAVDTVLDLIIGLKDVAVFVVNIVGNEIEFHYKVNSAALKAAGNALTGDQEEAIAALNDMGIVMLKRAKSQQEFIDEVTKKAEQGYKMIMQLYNDPLSRTLMWDFFDSLYKSLNYRKQQTVVQRVALEIGIEVLLAVATAGAANAIRRGAQAAATTVRVAKGVNMANRIGPFTAKAIDHIADLSRLLDRPALKTPEKPPMSIIPEDLPNKKTKPDQPETKKAVDADVTELEAGEKGSWNKQLNGELKPNHKYKVGNYLYETDDMGRVNRVSGDLDLNTRDRNTYQQGKSGKLDGIKDGLADDDGGHLVASIFDGPGEQINYAPMNSNLNRGAWKSMENDWASALKEGKDVKIDIKSNYTGDSKRPSSFTANYTIDGKPYKQRFKNRAGG